MRNLDNEPLGANGMRHATVRMRKLVKLGTTTIARIAARHFSVTLNDAKYATGRPMTTHMTVAMTAILNVPLNTVKNVASNTVE